jgi:hypothetical protein
MDPYVIRSGPLIPTLPCFIVYLSAFFLLVLPSVRVHSSNTADELFGRAQAHLLSRRI